MPAFINTVASGVSVKASLKPVKHRRWKDHIHTGSSLTQDESMTVRFVVCGLVDSHGIYLPATLKLNFCICVITSFCHHN